MRAAKEIALVSVFTALLIGGQFVLSGLSGIEVVTVLLLSFSYYFGVRRGLFVANAFSFLRCFLFGFFPTVLILYFVYYNFFVAVFGFLGFQFKRKWNAKIHVLLLITACVMTVLFTGLDNIITPLFYGFSSEAAKAYAVASLTAVIPQVVCTLLTVSFLLPVLLRVYKRAHT